MTLCLAALPAAAAAATVPGGITGSQAAPDSHAAGSIHTARPASRHTAVQTRHSATTRAMNAWQQAHVAWVTKGQRPAPTRAQVLHTVGSHASTGYSPSRSLVQRVIRALAPARPARLSWHTRARTIFLSHAAFMPATTRNGTRPAISCPSNVWEGLPYLNRYDNYSDNGSGVCVVSSTSIHDSTFTSLTLVTTSTNYMEANVTVNSLTIPAGATVQAGTGSYASYGLYINNSLTANGTSGQPIVLTSYYTSPGQWGGIAFAPGSTGTLSYVHISYAGNGYLHDSQSHGHSTAMLIEGANPTITNSTVDTSGYNGVEVIGGGTPALSNDTITSNNNVGIYVTGGSAPSISNSTISINNNHGIDVDGGSTPSISNSTISDNNNDGIEVTGANTSPTLSGDTITNNYNYALNYDLPTAANLTFGAGMALSASGNGHDAIGVNGTLTGTLTTQASNLPLRSDNLTVANGAQYSAGGGATLQLGNVTVNGTMSISVTTPITVQFPSYGNNLTVNGTLNLLGTAAVPLVLTSGQASSPGQWDGIVYRPGSAGTVSYTHITYAGGCCLYDHNGYSYQSAILVDGANPSISNSTIAYSGYHGIEVVNGGAPSLSNDSVFRNNGDGIHISSASAPAISNDTLTGNGGDGIYMDGGSTPSVTNDTIRSSNNHGIEIAGAGTIPTVSGDTITNNRNYAMVYDLPTVPSLTLGGSVGFTMSGNGYNEIGVNGDLTGTLTIQGSTVPVRSDNLTVDTTGQFIVTGGSTVQLGQVTVNGTMSMSATAPITAQFNGGYYYGNLLVNNGGTLSVLGTATAPVLLTANSTSPYPGQWTGLLFRPSSHVTMSYAHISYAGGCCLIDSNNNYFYANLLVDGANTTISNTTFDYGGNSGIAVANNAAPTLSNDTFVHNNSDGIYVAGGSTPAITNDTIANNSNNGIEVASAANPTLSGDTINNNNNYLLLYDLPTSANLTFNSSSTFGFTAGGNGYNNAIGVNGDLTTILTIDNPSFPVRSDNLTVDTTGQFIVTGGSTVQLGQVGVNGTMTVTSSATAPATLKFNGTYYGGNIGVNNGGTLNLQGTATAPISLTANSSSPYPGQWTGLLFHAGSNVTMNYAHISYTGGCCMYDSNYIYFYTAILVDGANPSVTNTTIDDGSNDGIAVSNNGTATLSGDAINNNGSYPLLYQLPTTASLTFNSSSSFGFTASGNGKNAVGVNGDLTSVLTVDNPPIPVGTDNLTVDTTGQFIVNGGSTVLLGQVTVNGTMTLSGTTPITAEFSGGYYYGNINVNSGGTFTVQGTATAPVLLTANSTSPYNGEWTGLQFHPGSNVTMSYAHISYAGGCCLIDSNYNYYYADLLLDGTNPTISNTTFDHSGSSGVVVSNGGAPTLSNDTFSYNNSDGIYVAYNSTPTITNDTMNNNINNGVEVNGNGANPTLSGLTSDNNGSYPLLYDLPTSANLTFNSSTTAGYSVSGNGKNAIGVNGDLTGLLTVDQPSIPVGTDSLNVDTTGQFVVTGSTVLLGNVTVNGTMSMSSTATAAAVAQFNGSGSNFINVNNGGTLNLQGTQTEPISLTSVSSSPFAGIWTGINFYPGSSGTWNNVHLSYAGGCCLYDSHGSYHFSSILIDTASPTITDTTIDKSGGNDVEVVDGGLPALHGDSFSAVPCCGYDGVLNDNGSSGPTVDASNSYWGSPSGPSGVGPGTGTPVSAGVNFTPWLVAPPGPPQITVNPGVVSPRKLIQVLGANLASTAPITIFWDSTHTTPLSSTTTSAYGAFAITLTVPLAVTGTHTIIGVERSGGKTLTYSTPVQVVAAINLQHSSGGVGSHNAMSGDGFGGKETVKAYWNSPSGLLLGTTTTNSQGTFTSNISFTVPASATGTYQVYAIGQSSGAVVTSTFTIVLTPKLSINPTSGKAGSSATVTGSGYLANESVSVDWHKGNSVTYMGSTTTNASGGFSLPVTIPPASPGTYTVTGTGATSHATGSTTFTVTP